MISTSKWFLFTIKRDWLWGMGVLSFKLKLFEAHSLNLYMQIRPGPWASKSPAWPLLFSVWSPVLWYMLFPWVVMDHITKKQRILGLRGCAGAHKGTAAAASGGQGSLSEAVIRYTVDIKKEHHSSLAIFHQERNYHFTSQLGHPSSWSHPQWLLHWRYLLVSHLSLGKYSFKQFVIKLPPVFYNGPDPKSTEVSGKTPY